MTDCSLSEIDQDTGVAWLTGYIYGEVINGTTHWVNGIDEDHAAMAYRVVGFSPAFAEEAAGASRQKLCAINSVSGGMGKAWRIGWALAEDRDAAWEVFDVGGRCVRKAELGLSRRGAHVLTWNGAGDNGQPLPSGVYWLRISVKDGNANRKLVVIR